MWKVSCRTAAGSIGFFLACGCGEGASSANGTSVMSLTTAEEPDPLVALDRRVRAAVVERLRDPESAQFRRVRRLPLMKEADGTAMGLARNYCGEVNARNGFGGYTGFVPFHAMASGADGEISVGIAVSRDSPDSLGWLAFCDDEEARKEVGEQTTFDR